MICLKCKQIFRIVEVISNEQFCKNCGLSLCKDQFAIGCSQVEHRSSLLCLNCRVCYGGHTMIKPKSFRAFESVLDLYPQNMFMCNLCKDKKSNENSDALHCFSCKFDICKFCQANFSCFND